MPGKLYEYLSGDHDRLDVLLEKAVAICRVSERSAAAHFNGRENCIARDHPMAGWQKGSDG
jgi:hypothetical protein